MTGEYRDLATRIEAIAAELDDLAFAQLQAAVAEGAVDRPTTDRRLMQARRALDKAAGVLAELDRTESI